MAIETTILIRGSGDTTAVANALMQILPIQLRQRPSADELAFDCGAQFLGFWIDVSLADLVDDRGLPLSSYEVAIDLCWCRRTFSPDEATDFLRLLTTYITRKLEEGTGWDCLALEGVQRVIPHR